MFIRLTFVPHGTAEWLARVDRIHWTLAIGDWRFCPSKCHNNHQYCCSTTLPDQSKSPRENEGALLTPLPSPLSFRLLGMTCLVTFWKSAITFLRLFKLFADPLCSQLGISHNSRGYIYIYICCGVIIWAKFGLLRCYYLGQVCFLQNTVCQKHYKYRGFSTFFGKKNCARKFEVLLSGPSWSFLRCSQLGPNNNTYLAQIITPQNAFFLFVLLLKICWNTYFYSVFWTSTKIWQKRGKKQTITFDILQNTGS